MHRETCEARMMEDGEERRGGREREREREDGESRGRSKIFNVMVGL